MKTSDLIGPALDWAVAKCEGETLSQASLAFQIKEHGCLQRPHLGSWKPSTSWAQGGPLIEKERIGLEFMDNFEAWSSSIVREDGQDRESYSDDQDRESYTVEQESFVGYGPTPLIAAMRVFVASRLGNEVDVPEELAALVKGE